MSAVGAWQPGINSDDDLVNPQVLNTHELNHKAFLCSHDFNRLDLLIVSVKKFYFTCPKG